MNAYFLKWIAAILMVVDHVGVILFPEVRILRIIGRLSFPIFAFLIANGYRHTRDVKKYIFRLAMFGLVIHIFAILLGQPTNIFFTLALGLVAIYAMENEKNAILKVVYVVCCSMLAYLIKSDYSIYGVLLIVGIYLLKDKYLYMCFFILLLSSALYGFTAIQNFAAISPLIIRFYNGEKGPSMKYFFYIFYPAHLVILYGINMLIGG